MSPTLRPDSVVIATRWFIRTKDNDVIIARVKGRELIKRVRASSAEGLFIEGDNGAQSTDSRHFGAIPLDAVLATVIWPRTILHQKDS